VPPFNASIGAADRRSDGAAAGVAPEPGTRRLGEILLEREAVSSADLLAALNRQAAQGPGRARLGEILTAQGKVAPRAVAEALAEQLGLMFADLDQDPPAAEHVAPTRIAACLRHRAVPWRSGGGEVYLAAPDPESLFGRETALRRAFGLGNEVRVRFVVVTGGAFDRLMLRLHPEVRAMRARARTPRALSAEALMGPVPRTLIGAATAGAVLALLFAPELALPAAFMAALALNFINLALRLAVTLASMAGPWTGPESARRPEGRALPRAAAAEAALPRISLLIPLYKEPGMAAPLIAALSRLEHPAEKLDAVIALEPDDPATAEALRALRPPPWVRIVVTPPGLPRTKPRALNHALDFCRGEIVGIYDAEDRPAPDQLAKVAEAFANGSGRLACVQARLAFRNEKDGWIARCFAVEYVTWFHLVLPGMARLGLPLPLGGTSVFFRRKALERIGAWDAFNVTEDADLGMRLARAGYVTGLVDTETEEAATRRPLAWIRQRSRWQKGYLMTWLAHMRNPWRLWRDLGTRGFVGFQALFLGSAAAFLGQPLFWAIWSWWLLIGPPWEVDWFQGSLGFVLFGGLLLGQGVAVLTAVIALRRAGRSNLIPTALSLPLYFPLGSMSAVKATLEAVLAPDFWDKTDHGEEAPP
jgi:cellulose synthase/poly-beta-1,6-N-acetylglucosamine synthase-like glycosyltransferase